MLGALEVKAIARVAAQHRGRWKTLHTAVMYCLLAHRNNRTGNCWPERKDIASFCGVSERTVDRAIAQLKDWGALESSRLRALSSQQFGTRQYSFLFPLPEMLVRASFTQVEDKSCESEEKSCGSPVEPIPSHGTKPGGATGQIRTAIKEEAERAKAERTGPPKYTQRDFDERDWRKLQREIDSQREAGIGSHEETDPVAFFRRACERAGISTERGRELYRKMLA